MRVREAKDFLVQQTAEQASLEGVPLSDLEKRMMYFTESGEVPEDPIKLNEEFEAEYDTAKYEAKIARLMRHAYARLRRKNDETRHTWDMAIKCLRRGDHYVLVLLGASPGEEWSVTYFLKILTGSLAVIVVMAIVVFLAEKFAPQWSRIKDGIPTPNPYVMQVLFLGLVVAGFFLRPQIGRVFGWLVENILVPLVERKGKADRES
jgi:hypothetical protein